MKKIILFLMIINMFIVPCMAEPLEIMSPSVILIEQSSGRVLYEKGSELKRPMASVTKMMTALIVMDEIQKGTVKYEDMVTTSEEAFSMGGSQIYLSVGEKMSVNDMLKGLIVASGNDAAVALAEHICGSVPEFVKLMNNKAKEFGMNNTNFVNPNGLPEPEHYSTAKDMAILAKELLTRHPDIKKYTTIWMDTLRGGEFQLANTNKLIFYYEGMTGLKTGYADDALHCLAGSATRGNLNLITVVLGAETSEIRFDDTRKLMDYGFDNFTYKEGIKKGDFIKEVKVKKGRKKKVNLVTETDYAVLDDKKSNAEIEKIIEVNENIKAPIEKGQVLGKLILKKGDSNLGELNLVAENEVKKQGFFGTFADFFKSWMGIE